MKRFEHALVVMGFSLVLLALLGLCLAHLVDDKEQEQQRRSEMYKYIGDE